MKLTFLSTNYVGYDKVALLLKCLLNIMLLYNISMLVHKSGVYVYLNIGANSITYY